jgi:hypothetical protein
MDSKEHVPTAQEHGKLKTRSLTEARDAVRLLRVEVPRLDELAAEHDPGRAECVVSKKVDDVSGYEAAGAAHLGVVALVPGVRKASVLLFGVRFQFNLFLPLFSLPIYLFSYYRNRALNRKTLGKMRQCSCNRSRGIASS